MNSRFLCVIVIGLHAQIFAKKNKEFQLVDYMMNDVIKTQNHFPYMRAKKTRSYLECADKTGVSPGVILMIRSGNWRSDNPVAKAWVQCVLIENELMTDQSVYRLDVAFRYLSGNEKRSLEANIDKCLPTHAMPPVEISWLFAKCFQTVDPENSLF